MTVGPQHESKAPPISDGLQTLDDARSYIRDLIAVSTLPAIWMGAEPQRIAESLLAVIETTIRPPFAYVRLCGPAGTELVHLARMCGRQLEDALVEEFGRQAAAWAKDHNPEDSLRARPVPEGPPLCVCVYPLGHDAGGGILAVGFADDNSGTPSPLQRALINTAANQTITACRNHSLKQQAEEAQQETQALYEVSRALAAELDLQRVIQIATDAATRLTQAQFGAFFYNVMDQHGDSYMLFALSGAPRDAFTKFGMPRNTLLFEHTFRGTGPLRLPDVTKDERYGKSAPHFGMPTGHLPVCSYLAVPVISRTGEVHGGLFFGHSEPGVFSARAERLATGIASQAAVALDNAKLFERTEREIQQRRQAEQALSVNEERLRLAAEAAGFGTFELDLINRVNMWSDQLKIIFGLPPSVPTPQDPVDAGLIHPDDAVRVREKMQQCFNPAGDGIFSDEHRIIRPDGIVRWVAVKGQTFFADVGGTLQAVRSLGAVIDITERKGAEEALQESQRKLTTLLANLPGMAYRCPAQPPWPLTFVSEGVLQLTGWNPSDFTEGRISWLDLMHPDDVHGVEREISTAVGENRIFSMIYRIFHKNGETRWVLDRGQPIYNELGDAIAFEGFVGDLTERIRAEEALREADRRKDDFLATLAHELRNPLAPIRMATSILHAEGSDPAQRATMIAMIDRQSAQLVRLIDDLLDVSRITRGKIQLREQPIDIAAIMSQAVETILPLCRDRDLHLKVHLPDDTLIVEGDSARLTQVVGNILNNACKFSRPHGDIEFAAMRQGQHAVIRIRDNGEGIDPAQIPRVFEMFTQLDSTSTRTAAGLGIGLALARSLTELHGGTLEALSQGLGTGAEFVVRLPTLNRQVHISENGASSHGCLSTTRRILVVDDNADVRQTLQLMLQLNGHEVVAAANGIEALSQAQLMKPEVVLLDIGMPGIDGHEVARRLRRTPWGQQTRLIAMTGWGQEKDKQAAFAAGFDAHLTKPADPGELHRLLENVGSASNV